MKVYMEGRRWQQRSKTKSALAQTPPVCECGHLKEAQVVLSSALLCQGRDAAIVLLEDIPLAAVLCPIATR